MAKKKPLHGFFHIMNDMPPHLAKQVINSPHTLDSKTVYEWLRKAAGTLSSKVMLSMWDPFNWVLSPPMGNGRSADPLALMFPPNVTFDGANADTTRITLEPFTWDSRSKNSGVKTSHFINFVMSGTNKFLNLSISAVFTVGKWTYFESCHIDASMHPLTNNPSENPDSPSDKMIEFRNCVIDRIFLKGFQRVIFTNCIFTGDTTFNNTMMNYSDDMLLAYKLSDHHIWLRNCDKVYINNCRSHSVSTVYYYCTKDPDKIVHEVLDDNGDVIEEETEIEKIYKMQIYVSMTDNIEFLAKSMERDGEGDQRVEPEDWDANVEIIYAPKTPYNEINKEVAPNTDLRTLTSPMKVHSPDGSFVDADRTKLMEIIRGTFGYIPEAFTWNMVVTSTGGGTITQTLSVVHGTKFLQAVRIMSSDNIWTGWVDIAGMFKHISNEVTTVSIDGDIDVMIYIIPVGTFRTKVISEYNGLVEALCNENDVSVDIEWLLEVLEPAVTTSSTVYTQTLTDPLTGFKMKRTKEVLADSTEEVFWDDWVVQ